MSNKKFISYFHMLYTGLKGTAGAYMATLLVLLSAFAATGAEKTPTTGADPQALPIKASTKKKSEIIKKSPVDTKKILSGDFKVTNFVILNNTGLPDSQIYFNLLNTATTDFDTCPPTLDWGLFQWYGGTVGTPGTAAIPIKLNATNGSGLCYNHDDSSSTSNGWSGVSLADMRGSVLSNASSTTNTPTSSSQWWSEQTYSSLNLNNYPTTDTTVKGQFPTISMGLFGACTSLPQYPGRIAISAFQKFTNDKFDSSGAATVSPYLLIEGTIYPTDDPASSYPKKASNLDLSYVDQISIAADLELWTLANGTFEEQDNGWLAGHSLKTAEDATYNIFANALPPDGIQIVDYTNSSINYPRYFAFSHPIFTNYLCPYTTFLGHLITDTTASLNSSTSTSHPVVKVAGVNVNITSDPSKFDELEFGDCNYGNELGYDFATYFVDLSTTSPEKSQANWTKILDWYKTDSTTPVNVTPSDPTQYFSPNSTVDPTKNQYMLMLGTFLPSSDWALSPVPANSCVLNGQLSIQLTANNTIDVCTAPSPSTGPCSDIQTGPDALTYPIGGIFPSDSTSVTAPLGINFHLIPKDTTYLLKEFDLSVGKTQHGTGTLWLNLTNATTKQDLVLVGVTIPITQNEGLANSVVIDNNTYSSGFKTDVSTGWPLQIDWEKRTCTYHGTPLSPQFYYMPYSQNDPSDWTEVTASNLDHYNARRALNGVHGLSKFPDTYSIVFNGENLTVALTNGSPAGVAGTLIAAGRYEDTTTTFNYNINGNLSSTITDKNNSWLLNRILISPEPTKATTSLHLLAVSQADLLDPLGLAGNNVKYRFLRWNNDTPAWEEAFGSGDIGGWPTTTTTTGSSGPCAPHRDATTKFITVGPPQSALLPPVTTKGVLNNISGRCIGDVCAAFSFGMVTSTKTGNDFTVYGINWPPSNFPDRSTAIGALTTTQYFQLLGTQPKNNGHLPVGSNLTDSTKGYPTYDPYVSLGLNGAKSNCYFSGFGDRCSTYGGVMDVNPTLSIDSTPLAPGQLNLGNVPGIEPTNNTVIVITLHPILRPPTTDTIDSDLDNDIDTDSVDMSLMLLAFGECPPAPQTCPEDLNKDGVVDNGDFGLLLINFTN